jgi:hypothetical protein
MNRCYYCDHLESEHLPKRIRECKHSHCDCFAWDDGPEEVISESK